MEERKEPYLEEEEIDLYELYLKLKKRWKLIVSLTFGITLLTLIISLIMTPIYRAEGSVIPVSGSKPSLGALSGLAELAGVPIPTSSDEKKILALLESRTIKERVIRDLNLIKVFSEELPKDRNPLLASVEKLDKMTDISSDRKTGVIKIAVEYKDPKLARDIALAYIKELEKLLEEKALTLAKMNRIFLERQLKRQREKLKRLSERLAQFQKRTRLVIPEEQIKGGMELYANLIAKKTELEVKLSTLETVLSPDNPQILALKKQLKAVKEQLKKLESKVGTSPIPSLKEAPEVMVKYLDLYREFKTAQAIYETLVKLYEQAKLEENKDTLYVEVIDYPVVPDKKVKPKRALMVAVAFFSSLFLSLFLALFLEWLENVKEQRKAS